jgi:pimeloyl-ACP methyl ester carboxylesterase
MTTFVLVHGAWHGGWTWERVTPLLQAAGATVHAPTLTGLDAAATGNPADIGLATHVSDVIDVLEALPHGASAMLVGHSYAGLVVREAADRVPERVEHITLIEGWAGGHASSLLTLAPDWFADGIRAMTSADVAIPAPDPAVVGIIDPDDADWLRARMRPQPARTFSDRTRLTGAVDAIPGTAINGVAATLPFSDLARRLGYRLLDIDAPHDMMLTHPQQVARALLGLAAP